MTMHRWMAALLLVALAACAPRVETAPAPVAPSATSFPVAPSVTSDSASSAASPTASAPQQPTGPGAGMPPNPMIGGAPMYPSRDIVDNLAQSPDHHTLVAALTVSGLAATLRQGGPYTLFAPTDAAFRSLPAGLLDQLMQPANQARLTALLNGHIVAGRFASTQLGEQIAGGNGTLELTTLAGTKLTARLNGAVNLLLRDPAGGFANIAIYDIFDANGITHVIDKVLLPAQNP
jgi:uncharacterized surface protein with fasciclin (FAS1) repeats